jgi:hypothetical protein
MDIFYQRFDNFVNNNFKPSMLCKYNTTKAIPNNQRENLSVGCRGVAQYSYRSLISPYSLLNQHMLTSSQLEYWQVYERYPKYLSCFENCYYIQNKHVAIFELFEPVSPSALTENGNYTVFHSFTIVRYDKQPDQPLYYVIQSWNNYIDNENYDWSGQGPMRGRIISFKALSKGWSSDSIDMIFSAMSGSIDNWRRMFQYSTLRGSPSEIPKGLNCRCIITQIDQSWYN